MVPMVAAGLNAGSGAPKGYDESFLSTSGGQNERRMELRLKGTLPGRSIRGKSFGRKHDSGGGDHRNAVGIGHKDPS